MARNTQTVFTLGAVETPLFGNLVLHEQTIPNLPPAGPPSCRGSLEGGLLLNRPEIEIDGISTRVLVEQLGAVDVNRLGHLAGHLGPEEQWGVDAALLTVLGLD